MINFYSKIRGIRLLISLASSIALSIGCGGGAAAPFQTGAQNAADFSGIQVVNQVGTSWKLSWDVLNAQGVLYTVYVGSEAQTQAFAATTIKGVVSANTYTYTPEEFYSSGELCFLVKINNKQGDVNQTPICRTPPPVEFAGVSENISSTGDGSFEIEWQTVDVPGIMYYVYSGPRGFANTIRMSATDGNAATPPLGIETENYFTILQKELNITRADETCFVVRYVHPDLDADTNEKEACTPTAPPIQFDGVHEVISGTSNKELTVRWAPSPTEGAAAADGPVQSYVIYADAEVVLATIPINDPDLTDDGTYYSYTTSYPGGNKDGIPITVKAYDEYGREDANSCTAIIKLNSGKTSSKTPGTPCEAN